MQEDLLAVQEQVVEEELAEHQLQSLLPLILASLCWKYNLDTLWSLLYLWTLSII